MPVLVSESSVFLAVRRYKTIGMASGALSISKRRVEAFKLNAGVSGCKLPVDASYACIAPGLRRSYFSCELGRQKNSG